CVEREIHAGKVGTRRRLLRANRGCRTQDHAHQRDGQESSVFRHCCVACPSTVPSASVTRVARPVCVPSRAGLKSTVIVSPGLKIVLDQPERANTPGGRPSSRHSVLPFLPSSTSR